MFRRAVCRDDFPQRVPAVSGAAAVEQVHSAVVRRNPGGLDDLHAVLPDVAVRRICVRPPVDAAVVAALAGGCSSFVAADRSGGMPDCPVGGLETDGNRRPDAVDSPVAFGQRRVAVLRAVIDRTVVAKLVQPIA